MLYNIRKILAVALPAIGALAISCAAVEALANDGPVCTPENTIYLNDTSEADAIGLDGAKHYRSLSIPNTTTTCTVEKMGDQLAQRMVHESFTQGAAPVLVTYGGYEQGQIRIRVGDGNTDFREYKTRHVGSRFMECKTPSSFTIRIECVARPSDTGYFELILNAPRGHGTDIAVVLEDRGYHFIGAESDTNLNASIQWGNNLSEKASLMRVSLLPIETREVVKAKLGQHYQNDAFVLVGAPALKVLDSITKAPIFYIREPYVFGEEFNLQPEEKIGETISNGSPASVLFANAMFQQIVTAYDVGQ